MILAPDQLKKQSKALKTQLTA